MGRLALEGFEATSEIVDLYTVRLTIDNQTVREMEVVPGKHPFVILGRDWLEPYYLLLNGPQKLFVLSQTPLVIGA